MFPKLEPTSILHESLTRLGIADDIKDEVAQALRDRIVHKLNAEQLCKEVEDIREALRLLSGALIAVLRHVEKSGSCATILQDEMTALEYVHGLRAQERDAALEAKARE